MARPPAHQRLKFVNEEPGAWRGECPALRGARYEILRERSIRMRSKWTVYFVNRAASRRPLAFVKSLGDAFNRARHHCLAVLELGDKDK